MGRTGDSYKHYIPARRFTSVNGHKTGGKGCPSAVRIRYAPFLRADLSDRGDKVSEGGLEPPRPHRALGPQPSASTNSATPTEQPAKYTRHSLNGQRCVVYHWVLVSQGNKEGLPRLPHAKGAKMASTGRELLGDHCNDEHLTYEEIEDLGLKVVTEDGELVPRPVA